MESFYDNYSGAGFKDGVKETASSVWEWYGNTAKKISGFVCTYPKSLIGGMFILSVILIAYILTCGKDGFKNEGLSGVMPSTQMVAGPSREYWIKVVASTNPALYQSKIVKRARPLVPLVEVNKQQYLPKSNGAHLLCYSGGKMAYNKYYNTWAGAPGQAELLYQALADIVDPTANNRFDLVILTATNGLGDLKSVSGKLHATGKFDRLPWFALQDDAFVPYVWIYNAKAKTIVSETVGETSVMYENVVKI